MSIRIERAVWPDVEDKPKWELPVIQTEYGEIWKMKADLFDMSPEGKQLRALDGWKEHTKNGVAPAKNGALVDVIFRNGESSMMCVIGKRFDGADDWTITNDPRDVVEYKLLGNGILA